MSFKDALNINELFSLVKDIYSSVEAIDEFGHCAIPSEEYPKLKVRSDALIAKFKECQTELNKLLEEQTDWYGY